MRENLHVVVAASSYCSVGDGDVTLGTNGCGSRS